MSGVHIDHICYKCDSREEYEQLRALFEYDDSFIYQSIISKRRIAVIGFAQPLISQYGDIWYLELSDQKPDGSQKSSVDHIELISSQVGYSELLQRFSLPDLVIEENIKPHHSTHDIVFPNGVKIKLSHGKLVDKIYRDEMLKSL